MRGITLENVLQSIDTILVKLKGVAPQADRAAIVNNLTYAYCPVIQQDANVQGPQEGCPVG